MNPSVARTTWQLLEPYHAVVYFDPDVKATYESVGLKGYWMGYFGSRCAAMGAVGPEIVIATFYNFHPRMVRRALPDAWRFSDPDAVLAARLEVADAAVRRIFSHLSNTDVSEAAAIAREIVAHCNPEGRPLFAAHTSLRWPSEDHLVLWHAATLWREFRGDGHVAALLTHEIDGCEANVLATAAGVVPPEQRAYRGWSDDDWIAAKGRLQHRGLLEAGKLTSEGEALHARIESLTDELSLAPLKTAGDELVLRLHSLLQPLRDQIARAGAVPYPNAMALTRPREPT